MQATAPLRNASLLLLATSLTLAACNSFTGVEDLFVDEGKGGGGGEGGDGGNASGPATGAGGHTTTGTGTPTDTPTPTDPGDPLVDASGVSIQQIALYQGVKAVLMEGGNDAGNKLPIAAGRDALLRLFLNVDAAYNGQPVTARLTINGAAQPIEVSAVAKGNGQDGTLGSTLNFDIPGASIAPGFAFKVELLQLTSASKGPNPAAHYPASGFASTNAQGVGQALKIVLVPVKYGADGSNRLPDTSAAMIKGYKDLFYAMYPVPAVEITVRNPVQYDNAVNSNGNGWDGLLGYIGQVRSNDNAPFDAYYYGIFSPSSSVNQYCGGGCVAGLGNIGGPGDPYSRAAIGLGFSDDGGGIAWETAVHEIGHTHGRYHSPCGGAQGTDPNYPYSGAKIGVWGYNLLSKKLYNPSSYTDVMGYCEPIWVSDFTYKAFFSRIKSVNNASIAVPPELMNRVYDRARVDADGNVFWMPPVKLEIPPQSNPIEITVEAPDGVHAVPGNYYEYDHLPGGVVLWAQSGGPSSAAAFQWQGASKSLTR